MNKKENKILDKIVKMTPKAMTRLEKILFDMGVEEIKGEICSIHGDVCECSEDTKRKNWNEMKGTK